jgi:hypothetical protein
LGRKKAVSSNPAAAPFQFAISEFGLVATLLLLDEVEHTLARFEGDLEHAVAVIVAENCDAKASSILIAQGVAGGGGTSERTGQ